MPLKHFWKVLFFEFLSSLNFVVLFAVTPYLIIAAVVLWVSLIISAVLSVWHIVLIYYRRFSIILLGEQKRIFERMASFSKHQLVDISAVKNDGQNCLNCKTFCSFTPTVFWGSICGWKMKKLSLEFSQIFQNILLVFWAAIRC